MEWYQFCLLYAYKPLWEAESAVKDKLKDLESARFYDVRKVENHNTAVYRGKVNAKVGSYDGKECFVYFGEKNVAFIVSNEIPDDEEEIIYSVMWKGDCKKIILIPWLVNLNIGQMCAKS